MKVVFTQDVAGVALAGDVKNVANGHARNFLFPKGFAVLATPDELRRVESLKRRAEMLREEQQQQMQDSASGIDGMVLEFAKKARSTGSIYGSVSSTAIQQELKKMGHIVEKGMIKLEDPIRQLGEFEVDVELNKAATAKVKIVITASEDDGAAEDDSSEEEKTEAVAEVTEEESEE